MERLSGLDATFLNAETPTVHMHTLKVAIVDPLPEGDEDSFERFRDELAKRLHLLPPFRRRIVAMPLGFHHPLWIEDPYFDIDFHLHRMAVPAPGGRAEVDAVIADIASHPLDRRHPLWEVWRLEGLEAGGAAYVAKIHHAVADGVAAANLLANVMSIDIGASGASDPTEVWKPEPIPAAGRLLAEAFVDHIAKLGSLPGLILRTLGGLLRLIRHRLGGAAAAPMPFEGPSTSLNRTLTPARSFATTSVDFAEVASVKSALGVTMNDVVLSVVAGGLARFLEGRGESLKRPLVATIPVATPGAEAPIRLAGNRLSNLFTSLCTDIADPVARTLAIHAKMAAAKSAHEQLGASVMGEWMEYVPPRPYAWIARTYTRLGLSTRHRPAANAIVSNVRGPGEALYIAGARLRSLYSVGPILEGIGLNVTAWSYAGELSFTVLAGREAVQNASEITECITRSLADLCAAVERGESAKGAARATG